MAGIFVFGMGAGALSVTTEVGTYQNVAGTALIADVFGIPAMSTGVVTGSGASPVPLPATGAMLLSGVALGAALRGRRKLV